MSILVTGGTGFVGRYVVDALIREGIATVSYNRDYTEHPHPLVHSVQGELFDIPALVRTIRDHDVTAIVHTAAMSHPEISIELPITTFAANVDGTLKLFEAARMAGSPRIVNFSSECAYGHQPADVVVTEDAVPMPNTPYAVTKVTTEHLGRVYGELYGLAVVSLRVSEVYGPGLRMPEVLKDMLTAAVRGTAFSLPEGADHRFHFVHARDVAHAATLAASTDTPLRPVYNVSGGRQVTLRELADLVRGNHPHARIDLGPGHWTGWDRQGPWDISAAARDFGYTPQWSLEQGLADYASWLTEHEH
ncbi:NAD-dependent epimerase/dehydratase family protein [Embleya sp. NPDC001921]